MAVLCPSFKVAANALRGLGITMNEHLLQDIVQRFGKLAKSALKKLNEYFGDHSKFQYKTFSDNNLPTGSDTVESAIRRVINLRIKGAGLFWKRENAENVILLRSLVLTGKLKMLAEKHWE